MIGDAQHAVKIRANSIHHSFNKCITMHMTSNLDVEDNVCARIVGHIFYEEHGAEENISFRNNLGIGAMSNSFDIYKVTTVPPEMKRAAAQRADPRLLVDRRQPREDRRLSLRRLQHPQHGQPAEPDARLVQADSTATAASVACASRTWVDGDRRRIRRGRAIPTNITPSRPAASGSPTPRPK
jgi:hypothetical protein